MKMLLQAVLFDFDGTLTEPGILDFQAIRKALKCPPELLILEYIEQLTDVEKHSQAIRILESFETNAAEHCRANEGAEEIIPFLKSESLKLGIITRNSLRSVLMALKSFRYVNESDFNVIITRDNSVKPKPDPGGILMAADRMHVSANQILVVGDYRFDVEAGHRAGTRTVFLDNRKTTQYPEPPADFTIHHLNELKNIIFKLHEKSVPT